MDGQTGAALSGVTVTLTGLVNLSGSTDGSGSFQQVATPPGSYQLTASYSGYTSVSVTLSLKAGAVTDVGVLRMSRTNAAEATTASISGIAADAGNGQPLSGVLVTIAGAGKSALTDGLGRYSIDAVAPGVYGISAAKSGYSSVATSFGAVAGGSYAFSPRLPSIAAGGDDSMGCRIYGKLLKAINGTPVSGASITLSGVNTKVATSDATGAYLLSSLVSGNTTIRVAATGYDAVQATAVLSCATPSATEFSPRLYPTATSPMDANTASLAFTVVDSATGSALSGVTVAVTATGQSGRNLTSGADGRVLIDKLPLASVQAQLSLAGYDGVTVGVTITGPQAADIGSVPMKKSRSAVVTGIVTQAVTGQVLEGASVVLSGATSAQATTDSAGRFMLAGLAAGTHTVTIGKAGFASASSTFDAIPGGEYVVSPSLRAASAGVDPVGCRLSGTVLAAQGGVPMPGVQIALTGSNSLSTTTDATGAYNLNGLASGNTRVAVSAANFDGATFDFRLGCSNPNSTDYSPKLYPAATSPANANTASVTFTLLDAAKGAPLAGVDVRSTPQGQATTTVTTQANGKFTVSGLKQSMVQLQATVAGYAALDLSFQVVPLQDVDMGELRLRPAGSDALLPDLQVSSVSRTGAVTDPQSLSVSGEVHAIVINKGLAPADRAVELLAFEDRNRNGRYDPGIDPLLGKATLSAILAVGDSATVSIPVNGSLLFRDAPIHVWVDSKEELAEKNEANNVRSTADAAQVQPSIGTFNPVLKWHWDGSGSPYPDSNQVMMSPVIGRFVDTNSDGKIDVVDDPVVVFSTFPAGGATHYADGVIRVVNGRTGADVFFIKDLADPVTALGGLALADLDGDGKPELIAVTQGDRLVAYRNDGSKLWVSDVKVSEYSGAWGGPAIADLDGDGSPEIIYSRTVLNARGKLKWLGTGSNAGSTVASSPQTAVVAIADLFGTGQQNVIVGGSVYSPAGELLWQARDGYAAVADFEGRGEPSIAVVNAGTLSLYSRTGQLRWVVPIPGSGRGGPPTIADVDGDGVPDIGVAASGAYTVFRADGSVLWSHVSQDFSSQMTGSTVFDFDGNGSAEVLYADEIRIRAFKGATGNVLWEIPNSSGTAIEYPLVVDVDGDGHADLVSVANDYYKPANATALVHGVRVFQDQSNSWVNTRQVWNQHAYSITNINDDLSVPTRPTPSWKASNTFRANKRIDGLATDVADLTASLLRVADNGSQGPSVLTVRVGNGGALAAPAGVKIAFFGVGTGGRSLLGVSGSPNPLGVGGFDDVSLTLSTSLAPFTRVEVAVDDDGTGKHAVTDFDRGNNLLSVDLAPLATHVGLEVSADAAAYHADQLASFTATASNGGSFPNAVQVRYLVQTADGQPVAALLAGSSFTIAPGATSTYAGTWNTASTYAGAYRVVADLLDVSSGRVLASAQAGFAIQFSGDPNIPALAAGLQLDKGSYNPGDSVRLVGRVTNLATNQAWQGLVLQTELINPDGSSRWNAAATLDDLAASGMREQGYGVPLGNAAAGTYQVRLRVMDAAGTQRAETVKAFSVTSTASTGIGLAGHISVTPKPVPEGDVVSFAFDVSNHGNAEVASLPLRVDIVAPQTQQLLASMPFTVTLASGGNYSGNAAWTATADAGTNLVAVLQTQVAGRDVALAQETFNIAQASPPQLSIVSSVDLDTRLLVLVTCPASSSPTCMADRVAAVKSILDGIDAMNSRGLPYKIVTTATDFENQFHCGIYNAYWISGGGGSLSETLIKELREAVQRGEALLVDGLQSAHDAWLYPVTGLAQQSPPSGASMPVNLASPFSTGVLNASGPDLSYTTTTAQVSSRFSDGSLAIASNRFGAGWAWAFAFDLPQTLMQNAADEEAMVRLRVGLSNILGQVVNKPASLTLGDVALLNTRVANLHEGLVTVEWRAQLPVGTELVASNLAPLQLQQPTDQDSGSAMWRATLPFGSAQSLFLRVKVKKTGAALDIPVSVYSIAASGDASLHEIQTHHLETVTANVLSVSALTAVQALAPTAPGDIEARDHAAAAIEQAQALQQEGNPAAALASWMTAADEVRSMAAVSEPLLANVRSAIAWAAETAADGVCPLLETLRACISGTLELYPGYTHTVPMGTTVSMMRTVSNSCATGFDSVNMARTRTRRGAGSPYLSVQETVTAISPNSSSWLSRGLNFATNETSLVPGDYVDFEFAVVWRGVTWPFVRDAFLIAPPQ